MSDLAISQNQTLPPIPIRGRRGIVNHVDLLRVDTINVHNAVQSPIAQSTSKAAFLLRPSPEKHQIIRDRGIGHYKKIDGQRISQRALRDYKSNRRGRSFDGVALEQLKIGN